MPLIDDFRQAWAGLRNAPGFLAVAATVLALGLGATIFMFGVISTTILTPPPFPHAERLYLVKAVEASQQDLYDDIHYLDYLEFKKRQRTFENISGFYNGTMAISGEGLPERYSGGFVAHDLFDVLGVKPMLGRDFEASDDVPGAEPTVILSYDLWRTKFDEDPKIIGKSVRVNSVARTVIGVAPKGFDYPDRESLWIPMAVDVSKSRRGDVETVAVVLVGRLAEGVTATQAADDLASIAQQLGKEYPRSNSGKTTNLMAIGPAALGITGARIMFVIFGAVWLVLLVACANVASLIFVRANFRVYEAGLRVALGARRPRLVRQMLAESVIVSLVGLIGGVALAAIGLYVIDSVLKGMLETPPPTWWRFTIDWRVTVFACGAALFTGLLSGIVPALRASRPDVMQILRDGGRTGTGLRLGRFTTAMVIAEICMSAVVLTAAGLLTRNAMLSVQQDLGADVSEFMSGRVALPEAAYPREKQAPFFEQLVATLKSKPGVRAVASANAMPGTGAVTWLYTIDGHEYPNRADMPKGQMVTVLPGFFEGMNLPVRRGRDFDSRDREGSLPVAIVNEAFVEKHFQGRDVLGARVRTSPDNEDSPWRTIVGVVPNVQHDDEWAPGGNYPPGIYLPLAQQPLRFMTVAVRGDLDPHAYGTLIRETVQSLDPDLPVYWLRTVEEQQAVVRGGFRVLAGMLVVFAAIAVVLAAVGIYGVLAFATGQRNREIGVRRAIGARDRQILLVVMRGAAIQLVIGLGLGALLSPLMGRVFGDALIGLPPDDPVVYTIVFTLLIAAATAASWIPALRALRVQPAAALRYE
jgi:putative ABC transport system permease protein